VSENWTWEAHFLKLEQEFYAAIDGATVRNRAAIETKAEPVETPELVGGAPL
jgi:hypothetical protein